LCHEGWDLGEGKNKRLQQNDYPASLKLLQKQANGRKPVFLLFSNDCLLFNIAEPVLVPAFETLLCSCCVTQLCGNKSIRIYLNLDLEGLEDLVRYELLKKFKPFLRKINPSNTPKSRFRQLFQKPIVVRNADVCDATMFNRNPKAGYLKNTIYNLKWNIIFAR
jgi:hypothetical protein